MWTRLTFLGRDSGDFRRDMGKEAAGAEVLRWISGGLIQISLLRLRHREVKGWSGELKPWSEKLWVPKYRVYL